MTTMVYLKIPVIIAFVALCRFGACQMYSIHVSTQDLDLLLKETINITVTLQRIPGGSGNSSNVTVRGFTSHGGVLELDPTVFNLSFAKSPALNVTLHAIDPGHDVVFFNSTQTKFEDAFVRVDVGRSHSLATVSIVVGWIYFVAWSISFYPQLYENFKRKSVVGLNFDFLALNLLGFILYSLFNCGLYWIPEMESEYFERHPRGLNPVQLNDIFFSLHAAVITLFTILQCTLYERGGQRVSKVASVILGIFFLVIILSAILSAVDMIHWLDFLYICSYVKLTITLIKYIPQAFMNYRRKSTIGWSIGNVVLDFTGGILSMLQMVINADNYNDWDSIFGDPTKFGLGLFSVLFDIFFLIQHYVLYRHSSYEMIDGNDEPERNEPEMNTPEKNEPKTNVPERNEPEMNVPERNEPETDEPTEPSEEYQEQENTVKC